MKKANICAGCISLFLMIATSEAVMASLYDIIYTEEGQLCSTSVESDTKPSCIESNIEYESASWSPDGQFIVAGVRDLDGSQVLSLLQFDGTVIGPVEKSAGFSYPLWSPDGQFIYAVSRSLGPAIGRWSTNGQDFERVPVRGIPAQGPVGPFEYIERISLSSDGKSIAILAEGFNKILIAEHKNDAFEITTQMSEGFASVVMSVWLDESHLLLMGNRDHRRADLWELNVKDGSVLSREVSGLLLRDSFVLSPDKESIVVCGVLEDHKGDTRWNLWHYTFSSAKLTKLTNGEEDLNPDWKQ